MIPHVTRSEDISITLFRTVATVARLVHVIDPPRPTHTALTWMAEAGIDLHILQRVADHQDPAITARYLHPDVQAMLDARDGVFRPGGL